MIFKLHKASAALTTIALLTAAPALASEPPSPRDEARAAADAFFEALRSEDKNALATVMIPEAMIFVHNRMDPDNPRVDIVPVAQHLERWARGTRAVDEVMTYDHVLVDGDMAQVWGPYTFWVEGKVSHCGINSMSLVKQDGAWKVGNTSFTMVPPNECAALNAPTAREE